MLLDKLCTSQEAAFPVDISHFLSHLCPSILSFHRRHDIRGGGKTSHCRLLRLSLPLTLEGTVFKVPVLGVSHVCGLSYAQLFGKIMVS